MSAANPGSGSAIRVIPVGNTGEATRAITNAIAAPIAAMIPARAKPTTVSWTCVIPNRAKRRILGRLQERLAAKRLTKDEDDTEGSEAGQEPERDRLEAEAPFHVLRVVRLAEGEEHLPLAQFAESLGERRNVRFAALQSDEQAPGSDQRGMALGERPRRVEAVRLVEERRELSGRRVYAHDAKANWAGLKRLASSIRLTSITSPTRRPRSCALRKLTVTSSGSSGSARRPSRIFSRENVVSHRGSVLAESPISPLP